MTQIRAVPSVNILVIDALDAPIAIGRHLDVAHIPRTIHQFGLENILRYAGGQLIIISNHPKFSVTRHLRFRH